MRHALSLALGDRAAAPSAFALGRGGWLPAGLVAPVLPRLLVPVSLIARDSGVRTFVVRVS